VHCDVVTPVGTNLTGLQNCVDQLVTTFPNALTGANFPTMSVDAAGNLFAVWEEAPETGGNVTGDTQLFFSTSSNKGVTWSAVQQIPTLLTSGLHQAVMAWPGAGDAGRIDVAFYGAPEPWAPGDTAGPDSIAGHYGL